jgi:hypothetical protein
MAVDVLFFNYRGYAFKPESISFEDGETLELKINDGKGITPVPIIKRKVKLTLEGARGVDLESFQNERDNNIASLIAGSSTPTDMNIFGYSIEKALLTKVTPTAPVRVNGITLFDKVELEFTSQVYS